MTLDYRKLWVKKIFENAYKMADYPVFFNNFAREILVKVYNYGIIN